MAHGHAGQPAGGNPGGRGLQRSNPTALDLLLHRESIDQVEVHWEQQGLPATQVTEPGHIQELLALLDGVEVRRLSHR